MAPSTPAGKKDWTPPLVFAEYQLLWLLGRGGMGEVYLGHDKLLDRPVAIKFISTVAPDDRMKEQYLVEARAAARLQHPNVVTVHRVGEIDGRLYIVAEYVRGQTLESIQKPLPWQQALELGVGLARGLAEAHRRGVLHRDIKPGNAILADNGEIKLLDFGLAKCMEWSGPLSIPLPRGNLDVDEDTKAPTLDIMDPASLARAAAQAQDPTGKPAGKPGEARAGQGPRPLRAMRRDPARQTGSGGSVPDVDTSSGGYRRLAVASGIKGTPMYMAPEVLTGLAATRRSDVYSMGALLFELAAGVPPHYDVPLDQLQVIVPKRDAPPLSHIAPAVDPRFAAVIDRCLRRNPAERFASGEQLLESLVQLLPSAAETVPEGNPYRGLWPFEDEHRALFFGRRGEIGTLLERLRSEPCVVIAAESGIGKTSLCRAGLLPLVRDGLLEGSRSWRVLSVSLGRQPLRSLVTGLLGVLQVGEAALQAQLIREPASLATEVSTMLPPGVGLVLFVDQLEELCTVATADEARIVSQALGSLLTRTPNLRLLSAVRSDQVARVSSLPGLGEAMTSSVYNLRPLSAERLREVVVSPAQAKGVRFDKPETISQLVEATVQGDGGLPLLQLALAELWEAREGSSISPAALEAIGGLGGALARHADHVIGSMLAEKRSVARRVLCMLVAPTGAPVSRSEADLHRIDPAAATVLDALVRARLVFVRSTADGATYELSHSALASGWMTLQRWLSEPVTGVSAKPILIDRPSGSAPSVGEAAPRERRLRYGLFALALTLLFVGYGAVEIRSSRIQAKRAAAHIQQGQRELSVARSLQTELQQLQGQAFVASDQQRTDETEQILARAHVTAVAADRAYGRASHQLEAALNIDGGRADVRETLADILYERALAAEADHQESLLEDLLQRLALYDNAGLHKQRWSQPGRVTLHSVPAAAHVQLIRYSVDNRGHFSVVATWTLGTTPLTGVELEPGPYVFVINAPGFATSRLPILVGRATEIQQNLILQKSNNSP